MHSLTLYSYWRSSSSYRVRLALALKGVEHQVIPVNLLRGEQSTQEHRARSPMGFVPCLVINGKAFVESVAIIELLEDLFPAPRLYPADPFARARVRALVEVVNAGTQPLQNLSVLRHLSDDQEARAAWSRHFIARGLAAFEAMMEGDAREGVVGRFAYGDAPTAADCYLVPQLYNAKRFSLDLAAYPRLAAAGDELLAMDGIRRAMPENQPDAVSSAP